MANSDIAEWNVTGLLGVTRNIASCRTIASISDCVAP